MSFSSQFGTVERYQVHYVLCLTPEHMTFETMSVVFRGNCLSRYIHYKTEKGDTSHVARERYYLSAEIVDDTLCGGEERPKTLPSNLLSEDFCTPPVYGTS